VGICHSQLAVAVPMHWPAGENPRYSGKLKGAFFHPSGLHATE
jgi:hypothetical protein